MGDVVNFPAPDDIEWCHVCANCGCEEFTLDTKDPLSLGGNPACAECGAVAPITWKYEGVINDPENPPVG